MREMGNAQKQESGHGLNNRNENSHQRFRRRERAVLRFRQTKSLQKFVAVHSSFHNHFIQERDLYPCAIFKIKCTAALTELGPLGVA